MNIIENPFETLFNQLNEIKAVISALKNKSFTASKMISINQLCERYPFFTKDTVYYLAFHKKIPCYKTGKKLIFSIDEIEAWLKSQKRYSQAEIKAGFISKKK